MDKELNSSDSQTNQDPKEGRSLVNKLKQNVSEIISQSPLSKWFRKDSNTTPVSTTRRRQDDSEDEEDLQDFQPPAKRTKLPPPVTKESLSLNVSEALSPIASNNVKKPTFRHFPEPIAGPSGYQTRKLLNSTPFVSNRSHNEIGNASDNNIFKMPQELARKETHSDSEESTSGYSSGRLGSKEILSQQNSKQTSPLETSPGKNRSLFQNSSLFTNQTIPSNRVSSLSNRNPSFNPSTFASSSFANRTTSTKQILSSPFYNGQTVYGGASAYGRNTGRSPQDLQKVLKKSTKFKPVSNGFERRNLGLGRTARKIMDTLEQYSSPISDAKKIPVASKKRRTEGSLTKFIGANPYIVRDTRNAPNKALHVPSITDTLKRKMTEQKTILQDSTEAVRKIAATPSTITNSDNSYQLPPVQSENKKFTSKMKTKITSVRSKMHIDEPVPEVKLNPISLPIKELPKFDFPTLPPPTIAPSAITSTSSTVDVAKKFESTPVASKLLAQNDEFRFSAPLVLAECLKPLKALNNFTFSEPLIKKRKSIHAELNDQENIIVETHKTKKINGDINNDSLIEKFKPKEGSWECSTCLIRNQPEKLKCAACQNPKIKPKTDTPITTPITLKLVGNSWECPTCMIRNQDELLKCAACQESKPGKSNDESNKSTLFPKPTTEASFELPVTNSWGNKFNKAAESWECPSCMIMNKNELSSCLACTVPKPGSAPQTKSFGSDFKKKPNQWECGSCMVQNDASADKCPCCGSVNPNKPADKTPAFSFGMDYSGSAAFSFGIPPASQNAPKTNASQVFGEKREVKASETTTFSFGVPAKEAESKKESSDKAENVSLSLESKTNEVKPTFTFGSSEATSKPFEVTSSKSTPTFSFGSASKSETTTKSEEEQKTSTPSFSFTPTKSQEQVAAATFSFGSANKTENTQRINPLLKPGEKLPEKATVAPVGFSFGLPKSPAITEAKSDKPTKRTREEDSAPQAKIPTFDLTPNGDVSNKNTPFVAPTANFSFGTANPSAPMFGSNADSSRKQETFKFASSPAKPSNGFSFGSTPAAAFSAKPAETKPFSFATPAQPTQSPGTFSFGKTADSKPATFSFNAAPENKPANQFSFAPVKPQQPTFGSAPAFNFSANQKPASFGSAGNLFGGAPQNPPAPVNGNFSFGASEQKATGFSFGASQNAGFNFGSGGASAPGGFNFNSATPALEASSKPSFNFTGGAAIASFSAPPAQEGTSAPQRKIKKAVRRTVR
ncbi:unnamed protein product [Ceutorhynchus assimilis]|uniref:Nuclear pore complex protein Nup153 n=1 Tax=Ceutorhynchus assimilis TaxID=467358 RepID=A0A9N9MY56_9CUCU|nr:unnamed protein product [Ceutorhynchus assimilis]